MLNNNGGQAYQVEDYFKSEAYLFGLKNDLRNQGDQLKKQGNNLAAWQSAYRNLEHVLTQWQQAHEQQALAIARLNQRYANLDRVSDEAIAAWELHSSKLADTNTRLQAQVNEQQKVIDSLQLARVNQPAAPVADKIQATITALQELNTQLQAQVASMETDLRLEDAGERERHLTDLVNQNAHLASKVTNTIQNLHADMIINTRILAELQSLSDAIEAQSLHLEDALRIDDLRLECDFSNAQP